MIQACLKDGIATCTDICIPMDERLVTTTLSSDQCDRVRFFCLNLVWYGRFSSCALSLVCWWCKWFLSLVTFWIFMFLTKSLFHCYNREIAFVFFYVLLYLPLCHPNTFILTKFWLTLDFINYFYHIYQVTVLSIFHQHSKTNFDQLKHRKYRFPYQFPFPNLYHSKLEENYLLHSLHTVQKPIIRSVYLKK